MMMMMMTMTFHFICFCCIFQGTKFPFLNRTKFPFLNRTKFLCINGTIFPFLNVSIPLLSKGLPFPRQQILLEFLASQNSPTPLLAYLHTLSLL
ncbi:uncharacterized protein LOC128249893 isoform X2 [Octopus bimaculoides]|uniref:uncharacterized protein LOC128249893 isoform X2 n=1 Tax=Octopus bimaculoides TaxID=37653 RepID=UPI0022E7C7C3|nr:uncharacterized protein LOC128249893 isoform X2 [Octopus bimaculoides]